MLFTFKHFLAMLPYFAIYSCLPGDCAGSYSYNHTISIDPMSGNDTNECIQGDLPCKTLPWAFAAKHRRNSTLYLLEGGTHFLNSATITFREMSNLKFMGNSRTVVIHCTVGDSGLAFHGIKDVEFESLTFLNCSAIRNSTSKKYVYNSSDSNCCQLSQAKVALYFYLCSNVKMVCVNVSHSPNATGVIMYNTIGVNVFNSSTFEYNQLSREETKLPGGGGFYVEFTYCVPNSTPYTCSHQHYSDMPVEITSHNSNATYSFHNCTFLSNIASNINYNSTGQNNTSYIIPHKSSHMAFGCGGGLSIMTRGNASNNSFAVTNCAFKHNHAVWGGGLLVNFVDVSLNNSLYVNGSVFYNNTSLPRDSNAHYGMGGGGMRIGHYLFRTQSFNFSGNRVHLSHCNFTRNHAVSGGGLSISPTLQFYNMHSQIVKVNISQSLFQANTAKIGAALEVTLFPIAVRGGEPNIYITNCNFSSNSLKRTLKMNASETGVGTVYSNGIILHFRGRIHFKRNGGSALAVVGRRVSFEDCTVLFIRNHGRSGGAINLLGVAYILVDDATDMRFVQNWADVSGGAIRNKYIEKDNLVTYPNCFVRHIDEFASPNEWKARFYFEDNYCKNLMFHTSTIYTTSVYPCSWPGWEEHQSILCGENWTYCRNNKTVYCSSEIRTDSGFIGVQTLPDPEIGDGFIPETKTYQDYVHDENRRYCNTKHQALSDVFSHNTTLNNDQQLPLKVIPGRPFILPLRIFDDFCHINRATTVFAARVVQANISEVDPRFTYSSGGYLQLNGISNNTVDIHLDTISERSWHVQLRAEILDCPSGFLLSNDPPRPNSMCICNPKNYQKILHCDQSEFQSFLRNGYWMGKTPESNESLVVSLCLPGFCKVNTSADYINLPHNISSSLCQNRKGVLCGECVPGYGPAVNRRNYECIPCSKTNNAAHATYYVLAVYLPLLLLFTGIILLKVRLTTGPANAFIFYSQIISSTFDLTGDNHIPLNLISKRMSILLEAYRIPYGILNLDFLENFVRPLCLSTKLNALDALQLDYIVASFPLIMILLVLLALKIKSCFKSICSRLVHFQQRRHQLQDYSCEGATSPIADVRHSRLPSRHSSSWFCFRWYRNWQVGESLLHAFSAFLLLSYTKFALTSSYIVNVHPILSSSGSQVGPRRAYYAGQFTEHDPMYLWRYYIPSCFIIVIIAVIPLMLLGFPIIWLEKCISKINCLWQWYPVTKIHVFMDTFQGCYRDDRRFFAAMYFLFRLSINVGYILTDTWLQQFVIQQVACTIFIVIFLLCWPYREEKWFFNYVDFLMLSNLAIVNALSLYLFAFSQTNHGLPLPKWPFVNQYILVFLPLIYMVLYIMWYLLRPKQKEKLCQFFRKISGHVKPKSRSRRQDILHQNSTPSYFYTPNTVAVHTSTHNHDSDTMAQYAADTVRPTIVTASDLEFIEEESLSESDEDEAMLARASGPNRYKPPPQTEKESRSKQEPQRPHNKGEPLQRQEQGRSLVRDDRNSGKVGPGDKVGRGSHTNELEEEWKSDPQRALNGATSTKDSGFATGSSRDLETDLSERKCGLDSREDTNRGYSLFSSSKDYGTMRT